LVILGSWTLLKILTAFLQKYIAPGVSNSSHAAISCLAAKISAVFGFLNIIHHLGSIYKIQNKESSRLGMYLKTSMGQVLSGNALEKSRSSKSLTSSNSSSADNQVQRIKLSSITFCSGLMI
jgi:hypothetical protein